MLHTEYLSFCCLVNLLAATFPYLVSKTTSVLFLLILKVPKNCAFSADPACPHDLNTGPFYWVTVTAVCAMFLLKCAISYAQCLSAIVMSGSRTTGVLFDLLLGALDIPESLDIQNTRRIMVSLPHMQIKIKSNKAIKHKNDRQAEIKISSSFIYGLAHLA